MSWIGDCGGRGKPALRLGDDHAEPAKRDQLFDEGAGEARPAAGGDEEREPAILRGAGLSSARVSGRWSRRVAFEGVGTPVRAEARAEEVERGGAGDRARRTEAGESGREIDLEDASESWGTADSDGASGGSNDSRHRR